MDVLKEIIAMAFFGVLQKNPAIISVWRGSQEVVIGFTKRLGWVIH